MALILGCGPGEVSPRKPASEAQPLGQSVETGSAEVTRFSKGAKREAVWSVRWTKATLEYGEDGSFGGRMLEVSGTIFGSAGGSSTFTASEAKADKESSVLHLIGEVRLHSSSPKGEVRCDEVRWDAARQVVEAHGNVRFETKDYVLGPFETLWFSPELRRAGTPDAFEDTDGKRG